MGAWVATDAEDRLNFYGVLFTCLTVLLLFIYLTVYFLSL